MRNNNLFLVGPMGVGKSTIGRLLADFLCLQFVDLDAEIERRCGADITWIFDKEGEAGFRKREHGLLAEVSAQSGIVLATGGGVVLSPDNRQLLTKKGFVVYLQASVDQLLKRTAQDKGRPLLQVDNPESVIRQLLQDRAALYHEVADLEVSTEKKKPAQVAEAIVSLVQSSLC